jgi:hypothetical protein
LTYWRRGRIRSLGKAWILEQAGIVFDAKAEPGKLRLAS